MDSELITAAAAIRKAADGAVAGKEPLLLMVKALQTGGGPLVGVDLLAAYPPSDLIPDVPAPQSRLVLVLSALRDIAVFAPIAITWWALRSAIAAWYDSGSTTSFLRFWQSSDSVIPISESALWIVVALVTVAALTVAIVRLDGWAAQQGDRAAERDMLAGGLARATLALSPRSTTSVSGRELTEVSGRIWQSTQQLTTTLDQVGFELRSVLQTGPANKLLAALDSWTTSAGALTTLGAGLTGPTKIVQEWTELRQQMEAEERRLRDSVEQLVGRLEGAADRSAAESKAYGLVVEQVRDSTSQLAEALSIFSRSGESLQQLTGQMQSLLRDIALNNDYGGSPAGVPDTAWSELRENP